MAHYNLEREHQAIGDVPPIRRFELVERVPAEIVDPDEATDQIPQPSSHAVGRRVDRAGRISILKHRYHLGRHLAGQQVAVDPSRGCSTSPTTGSSSRRTHAGIWQKMTIVSIGEPRHPDSLDRRGGRRSRARSTP